MEQHPVPQNISSFQFKLIGDITLKQFAYVAGGVILAYIFTKFTFFPWLLRMPLAVITALLGFGLAFVPIEERPMDRWLAAFFKSIYLPTQYVWRKSNSVPEALSNLGTTSPPATSPTPTTSQAAPKTEAITEPIKNNAVTIPVSQPVHQLLPKPKIIPLVESKPSEVLPRFTPPPATNQPPTKTSTSTCAAPTLQRSSRP